MKSLTIGRRSSTLFQGMGVMKVIKQSKIFIGKCVIGLDGGFALFYGNFYAS